MSSDPLPSHDSYYAEHYISYEKQNPPHKIQFYMDLVERYVRRRERMLYLGVDLGVFLERATERFDCQGSDINRYGIQATRKQLPQVPLCEGSYECIPANPRPKAVVCWDILEHLPGLDTALNSIFLKLPKGGCLIGVVPVCDGPLGWLVHLLEKDPTHVTKISRKEWLGRLRQHGFDVQENGGIIRRFIGSHYLHFVRPQSILRSCGTGLYFVARKPEHT